MYRIEVNIQEKKLCIKVVIYKDHIRKYGQQNIKFQHQS